MASKACVVKSGPRKGRLKKGWKFGKGGTCLKAKGKSKSASKARRSKPKRRRVKRGMTTVQLVRRSRTRGPRRRSHSAAMDVFETNPGAAAAAYKPEGVMGARGRRRKRRRRARR
jgi:hypothetical protein